MAWTAPTTRTTGTLITAAIWNTDLTDNLTFLGVNHDHSGDSGDGGTIKPLVTSGISAGSSTSSTSYVDVTSASLSLTLVAAQTVIFFARFTYRVAGGAAVVGTVKTVLDATNGDEVLPGVADFDEMCLVQGKACSAGSRTGKVQAKVSDGADTIAIENVSMFMFSMT